jgi:deoxyribonuclease (pyrimidine dimer)
MTRINLVPVQELHDQHLFAEFREIKMVPKSLARSIAARGIEHVLANVPPAYVLGAGHVSFFYDKGDYLTTRYSRLRAELTHRNIALESARQWYSFRDLYGDLKWDRRFQQDYTPTPEDLALVRARIADRVAMKPQWYRYHGHNGVTPCTV